MICCKIRPAQTHCAPAFNTTICAVQLNNQTGHLLLRGNVVNKRHLVTSCIGEVNNAHKTVIILKWRVCVFAARPLHATSESLHITRSPI